VGKTFLSSWFLPPSPHHLNMTGLGAPMSPRVPATRVLRLSHRGASPPCFLFFRFFLGWGGGGGLLPTPTGPFWIGPPSFEFPKSLKGPDPPANTWYSRTFKTRAWTLPAASFALHPGRIFSYQTTTSGPPIWTPLGSIFQAFRHTYLVVQILCAQKSLLDTEEASVFFC